MLVDVRDGSSFASFWTYLQHVRYPANILPKRNRKDPICFSPYLYRVRNLVERFFNRMKQCRRVASRYDRLAANYLAFIKLAAIRVWLRAYKSTPWPMSALTPDFLGKGVAQADGAVEHRTI
jgi:hypothetical protein